MGVLTQRPRGWRQEDKEKTIAALAQEERGHLAEWLVPGQQVWKVPRKLGSPRSLETPKRSLPLSRISLLAQLPNSQPPQLQPQDPL